MDYMAMVSIDMAEFGQEGIVRVAAPTFRKRMEFTNDVSQRLNVEQRKQGIEVKNLPIGDWNILQRMLYIREAPFPTSLDGFLAYTDRMDSEHPGSADAFWEVLGEAIQSIDEGTSSPLEPSQGAGTQSSD